MIRPIGMKAQPHWIGWSLSPIWGWLLGVALAGAIGVPTAPDREIFQSPGLLQISITLAEADRDVLGASSAWVNQPKPKAKAVVSEGGRTYKDVALQLKGFTTFQSLEGTPSFTLDFNQFVPGQKFHGLTKISLNNSLQDPTRLSEKFARELFAAAGVPAPRADHALVSLNGRELGLYVLVEGYDKSFLKRHFQDATGNFYEGGTLKDIHRSLQLKSGAPGVGGLDVERLIQAARQPDPIRRFESLSAVLDVERFNALVAIEAMLCHSDSYSMNRNNYRIYHDPKSDRFVFLPHGLDRILGTHRSNLDLPIVPPVRALVARALLSTPEGRRRYVETAGTLFTNLFDPERLCRRVREIDAKIVKERARLPGDRNTWGGSDRTPTEDADDLCRRIRQRAAELKRQFAQPANLLAPTVPAVFNTNGAALLGPWRVQWMRGQPPAEALLTNRDGRTLLRLLSSEPTLHTTLYTRAAVPRGSYHFAGRVGFETTNMTKGSLSLVRYHAYDRFTTEQSRLSPREPSSPIRVLSDSAPEELEFRCEIRSENREVWLDTSTLQLVRGADGGGRPGAETAE